jgi:hypothetical protein
MSLMTYAQYELELLGMFDDGDELNMNTMMRRHILKMVESFADEGHSGFSANYAISLLTRLLSYKPLSPLTGEDDEWIDVSSYGITKMLQNKRKSSVFKDEDGKVYDIDGKVFWEWARSEDGTPYKSYYGNSLCRTEVTFPYTVPTEPIYEYRYSDAEPKQPLQNEEGFL